MIDLSLDHPRPQFQRPRSTWTSLDGPWEFAFDDADVGLAEGWSDGRALPETIRVPFAYQAPLSGLNDGRGDQAIHPVVWYARDLAWDEVWGGEAAEGALLLHFGAVDYRCRVWIDGVLVGENEGGHVPFAFDVAPYLRREGSRLVVRVEDPQDPGQPRGKQSPSGVPEGCSYYCTTGIWQSVWTEPVPRFRIDSLRANTIPTEDETGALGFDLAVALHAPMGHWELEIAVTDESGEVAHVSAPLPGAAGTVRVPVPDARLWSPESPHLYGLRVRLRESGNGGKEKGETSDEILDEVASYVGLRTIGVAGGRFRLNGRPYTPKMILDQGYWPDGGLTAPTPDALRTDVEMTKAMGFNGARKHQKIEDPRWLAWCDRLGLLAWGEMPSHWIYSRTAEERFFAEWTRAVRRDAGHPSLVTWVPVNESWGLPELGKGHAGQYAFLERVVAETRRLDPTRPIVDNDGWEHSDLTDLFTVHDYTPSAEGLRARYAETLRTGALPGRTWGEPGCLHSVGPCGHRGQPILFTEVGGLMLAETVPEGEAGWLHTVYGSCRSPGEVLARFEDLMRGLAALPFVAGFCYTQLADIEQETNGLLCADRRPKVPVGAIARILAETFPAP